MPDQDAILKGLEEKKVQKFDEYKAICDAVDSYKRSMGISVEGEPPVNHQRHLPNPFPDYPKGELLKKLKFLEDVKIKRWWKRKEMEKEIKGIEGDNTKALNSIQAKFTQYIKSHELIMVRFGSNKKVFYTTRPDLAFRDNNGNPFPREDYEAEEMMAISKADKEKVDWAKVKNGPGN
jgi:hypothetical protein